MWGEEPTMEERIADFDSEFGSYPHTVNLQQFFCEAVTSSVHFLLSFTQLNSRYRLSKMTEQSSFSI